VNIRGLPRFRHLARELSSTGNERNGAPPCGEQKEGGCMLSWSITLLVIALVAALLGFTGIAGAAAGIAKILFGVFLVLFVISLLFGRRTTV